MIQQRSENGYGFLRPGLKTGVENGIFWSEIVSGFGELGGTPLPRIPTPRELELGNVGFWREESLSIMKKNPWSSDENQQQTQPAYH